MATQYIEVLDPTGVTGQKSVQASAGVGNLDGKTIGFIDNGKPNYDIFLARIMEMLGQRFKFAGVLHAKKKEKDTGTALNPADMARLAADCDIVLNGICD
jgi:hypothetical protein